MPSNKKLLQAAAGNAGAGALYVEDVFSTYLYDGTGAAQTITNDIDLDGEGGLVWLKERTNLYTDGHWWVDTLRGANDVLKSNTTGAEINITYSVTAFNSDGFSLGANASVSSTEMASWTFRKAEKFFDVVTYTGNGFNRTISHSLASVPGFIFIKRYDTGGNQWYCYHSSLGNTKRMLLSDAAPETTDSTVWNNTTPTDAVFSLGTNVNVNASGGSYMAYLFASDAGGFGEDEDENIIKCGSYTGNGNATGPTVTLGFEPQYLLVKGTTAPDEEGWVLLDTMRGLSTSVDARLSCDSTAAENNSINFAQPTANGFQVNTTSNLFNKSSVNYIYMAIRRPMKTPESGTEVFALKNPGYPVDSNGLAFTSGFPVDWALSKEVSATDGWLAMSRLQGNGNRLRTNTSEAEASGISYGTFDHNTGWYSTASANMSWMFKRATGFFDVAVQTATQSAVQPATGHNLGVVPEFIISKSRDSNAGWYVYHSALGLTKYLSLSSTNAFQVYNAFGTTLTSTQFQYYSPASGQSIINYLFATVAGVSKVGGYTGTGNNLNVDCGFSAGARFILIKRTDSAGDWYVYDSVRGIVAGNDPYTFLNSSAAQVTNTDYIDPLSSGFTVTSSAPAALNASGGNYIFLAIA